MFRSMGERRITRMRETNRVRAAIYVRTSCATIRALPGRSPSASANAQGEGWPVVEVYRDSVTSKIKERGAGTAWAWLLVDIDSAESMSSCP